MEMENNRIGSFFPSINNSFVHSLRILPPTVNQYHIGSCSAVATTQCLGATVQMKFGEPYDPAKHSSLQELINEIQKVFSDHCYKEARGQGGFRGFPPEIALEYIKQYGVAVEAYHPYCGQRTSTPTPTDSARIWIQNYTSQDNSPYFDIRPIIRQQPIVGVLRVYKSLRRHREGVYQGAEDVDDARTDGHHAVVIFGYGNEESQYYYWIQNTWGPEWGDNGIGKVSAHLFTYFGIHLFECN